MLYPRKIPCSVTIISTFFKATKTSNGELLSCFGVLFSNLPGWPLWGHMDCLRGSGLCGLRASSQGTYNVALNRGDNDWEMMRT